MKNPQGKIFLNLFHLQQLNSVSETSQTGKLQPALTNTCSVTDYNCQTDTQILFTVFRHLSHENVLHPYFTKWVRARGRKQEWSCFPVPRIAPGTNMEWGTDKIKNCFARKNFRLLVDKWRVVRACLPYFLVPLMISTVGGHKSR